ncbi:hypothetical protein [Halorubrum sp. DTA46]|uniref:hypothetical protein n=1 Tax=Halorubrum sp. DTA46 TaxID=3402162 RepID=UPI003AABB6B3
MQLGATAAAMVTLGVGGASATPDRSGIAFDRVIDAVDELGADPAGTEPVNRQLTDLPPHALVRFPEGKYTIDGRVDLVDPGRIGFESVGDATFIGTKAGSGLNVVSADAVYYEGFTHANAEGSIRHRFDGAELVRVSDITDGDKTAASVDTRNPENLLEIVASDTAATYDVTVSGWIRAVDDGHTPPDVDVSGGCAEGAVAGGTHAFSCTGAITAVDVTGDAEVRLNGTPLSVGRDAAVVDPRLTNVARIDGAEGREPARYEFTATGDVALDTERTTHRDDGWERLVRNPERGSVTGRVGSDVDTYRFSGGIEVLEVDGPARVSIGTEQ